MKKKILALLALAMVLLLLAGCRSAEGGSSTTDDRARLESILDDISASMRPGTAGSSLTAARLTFSLISWAADSSLSPKETADTVTSWLNRHPELADSFRQQLRSISDTFTSVLKDGAADLMNAAGVEKDLSNLGSRLSQLVSAVLEYAGIPKG